ncbi:MAG: LysM peptidoglycan-binding domain-containing protein, partial [Bacteroidetes bacterium]|nr:LysM peptidoglycan-binding domain-containing protein [Bacteroidota bacterium]
MKDRFLIVIVAMVLCCMPSLTSGTPGGPDDVSVRNVPYIVVKGDKLKNIAVRFLVPVKTLKKLNKLSSKNFTCYPGMTLLVPVKVRPRGWDPGMEASSDAGMLSQDRQPSVDYEVIGDGFDLDIKDDFIPASEAQDDSVQFVRVGDHIERVDKRINVVSFRMDSLKQAEFGFSHDDDLNSVLGRMRMARDRYYSNGPLGKEIDSLHRVKATLNNLRIRLRNRITENEYLRDNVAYAKANYEREEMAKDTHWGDQITYESNYARIKAKHDELLVEDTAVHIRTDTPVAKPPVVVQASPAAAPVPRVATPVAIDTPVRMAVPPVKVAQAPVTTESKPAITPPVSKPAPVAVATVKPTPSPAPATKPSPVITLPATSTTAASKGPFGLLQRVDIAPMVIRHAKVSITEHPRQKGTLALLPREAMQAIIPAATRPTAHVADNATVSQPTSKNNSTSVVAVKVDSAKITAIKNAGDTTHHVPSPTVKKDTVVQGIQAKADTVKKSTIGAKTDSVHKATVATATKDTVKRNNTVAVHADTPHSIPPVVKADTTHKNSPVAITPKDTAKRVDAAAASNNAPAATPPAAPKKTNAPADNNFSMAEDNSFDGSTRESHSNTAKKQEQPKAEKPDAISADNDADAATGGAGRPGRKPKDQNKKEKKGPDAQDQVAVVDSSKILHEQVYVPAISAQKPELYVKPGPYLTLDMKYDSTMLYKEKKINVDPLASYKTDSNFMATDVQLKEIAITEVKNKPRYLIPVDSVSKIKGEFYLIRARQVLERGDF